MITWLHVIKSILIHLLWVYQGCMTSFIFTIPQHYVFLYKRG
nr:MAG TPA: hypothetical protein [Caudoviricetes sp.]